MTLIEHAMTAVCMADTTDTVGGSHLAYINHGTAAFSELLARLLGSLSSSAFWHTKQPSRGCSSWSYQVDLSRTRSAAQQLYQQPKSAIMHTQWGTTAWDAVVRDGFGSRSRSSSYRSCAHQGPDLLVILAHLHGTTLEHRCRITTPSPSSHFGSVRGTLPAVLLSLILALGAMSLSVKFY